MIGTNGTALNSQMASIWAPLGSGEAVGTFDTITGTSGEDHITGTTGDDVIHALAGDDAIDGGQGNDLVFGDEGDDFIDGSIGDDTLHGGTGDDRLIGNLGNDKVYGEDGNDNLAGNGSSFQPGGNDSLFGGAGDDNLTGFGGDNLYDGGAGIDSLSFASVQNTGVTVSLAAKGPQDTGIGIDRIIGIENLSGTAMSDSLTGNKLANQIDGGGGDTIEGGGGSDTLGGGGGDVTLVYAKVGDSHGHKADLITDLDLSDRIDLSAIDANTKTAGDQAFKLVSSFSGHAGELVVHFDSDTNQTEIMGDINGDGRADLLIEVAGQQSDFDNFVL